MAGPFLVAALMLAATFSSRAQAPAAQQSSILLTNAQQIAALSNNIPLGQYEARFQAVVIYVSPPSKRIYVQDHDLGVQINLTNQAAPYQVGNLVEVAGVVVGGDPALHLTNATATVLGDAPLPEPPLIPIHNLVRGDETFRYVRVRGTVRDMYCTPYLTTFLLTQGNYPFEVWLQTGSASLPLDLMDAEIEVTGHTYLTYHAVTGRPTGIRFHATDTNNIRVLKPGIADRFDGRLLLTIAEAAKLTNALGPRYRVAGTVTIHRPGVAYFIDDGTGVMHVDQSMSFLKAPFDALKLERDPQTATLRPGDRVEVIGARFNFFSVAPSLQATEFRRLGRAQPIKPTEVLASELFEGRHAGRLVTTTAQLIDLRIWGNSGLRHNMAMVLRDENNVFQANWEGDAPTEWNVQTEGYVRLTGVNEAERSPNSKRSTFKLLLRSSADVVPAPTPQFWTQKEFRRIALSAGCVAFLAGAWILLQRWQLRRLEHRVADRTADLSSANAQLKEEVAARQRAEVEVHRALAQEKQLSELKSRFVSMVSHEFRTPLGIITSSAEILDAYLERLSSEERKSNLRDITDATRHMSRMMEEVLLLGRVEAGKMTCKLAPLDLAVFGQRLVDEVTSATNSRCPIHFTAAPGLPEAQADEGLLRHILTNLLNNAAKYSPPGGVVEFQLESRGHLALFTVSDRGIGIPEADARLLFQAFHRGRNVGDTPGTGLGMTIVKRCVELHGGKIAFESKEGQGTTFVVALPLFGSPAGNGEGTTQFLKTALSGQNLTVIL